MYNNIYIIGDIHSEWVRLDKIITNNKIQKGDLLIILGDVGVNFGTYQQRLQNKNTLKYYSIDFLLIRGNHEQPCDEINTYKIKETSIGEVYVDDKYPNQMFAVDGNIYTINNKTFLTIGGAESLDKLNRIDGYTYWRRESVTRQSISYGLCNKQVDYILTHTCPFSCMPFKGIDGQNMSERLLEYIKNNVVYTEWFCGHWRVSRINNGVRFIDAEKEIVKL